jgi:hypothetical protein
MDFDKLDLAELGIGIIGNTVSAFIWLFIVYLFAAPRVKLAPKIERLNDGENRFRVPFWNVGFRTLYDIEFKARVAWREENSKILKGHELVVDSASRFTLPWRSETGGRRLTVAPKFEWDNLEMLSNERSVAFRRGDLELLPTLLKGEEAALIVAVGATHPLTGFRKVVAHIYKSSDFYPVGERAKSPRWL